MFDWIEPAPTTIPSRLREAVGGNTLVAEILCRRGVTDPGVAMAFLEPDFYSPSPPSDLPGMERAAVRLLHAIHQGEHICVWGDFDVDGQTATTLLVASLRDLGARVSYHIPVREYESHGVHLPRLSQLIDQGIELLLTCDTGITAHEAVEYASTHGIETVITDHHDLPPDLPEALAIVNPKTLPHGHPLAGLPGVGVAYKLAEELFRQSNQTGREERFLDLVALGIVADLAVVTKDTRYLLQRGLAALQSTSRKGLRTMMDLADLDASGLTEEHIAYVLAPRLNALGRLDDANPAVEFLTTQDPGRARILATHLEGLNAQRKLLTDQVFKAAQLQIERDPSLLDSRVLVLSHTAWPAGVIGIVASRLVEHYHKPTVLIAAPPGKLARGSARSVVGIDISAAIAAQKELLEGYGGHPMAAGLSLYPERIPEFRQGISRIVQSTLGDLPTRPPVEVAGYVELPQLSLSLASELERLAPFGPGNPAPVLASRDLLLRSATQVGRDGDHLQMLIEDPQGGQLRVIWWNGSGWPQPAGTFDLAYHLRAATFQGKPELQVEWFAFREVETPTVDLRLAEPAFVVHDHRTEIHPLPILKELLAREGIQLWCEGDAKRTLSGRDRYELEHAPVLVIWTTPPGRSELKAALERVAPEIIHVFAIDPQTDQLEAFLSRLTGLVKFSVNRKGGDVSWSWLAAATAQREATVKTGISYLESRGLLEVLSSQPGRIRLRTRKGSPRGDLNLVTTQLVSLLEETAAFRSYFQRSDQKVLFQIG